VNGFRDFVKSRFTADCALVLRFMPPRRVRQFLQGQCASSFSSERSRPPAGLRRW
jgi:hypothetical protein